MGTKQKEDSSLGEFGQVVERATVRIKRLLSANPEKVWDYLTESEKSAQWLASIDGTMSVGSAITLTFHNSQLTPHNEVAPEEFKSAEGTTQNGTVLIYDPPHKLSYTWGNPERPSEVTFELAPQDEKTLLTITHAKLPSGKAMRGVSSGWHAHLNVLRDKLEGKVPDRFWDTFVALRETYAQAIPEDL